MLPSDSDISCWQVATKASLDGPNSPGAPIEFTSWPSASDLVSPVLQLCYLASKHPNVSDEVHLLDAILTYHQAINAMVHNDFETPAPKMSHYLGLD